MINNNYIDPELKRRFDKYVLFTHGKDKVSVEYLAQATNVSVTRALSELQRLVSLGYFGNSAYIDYINRCIVIHSDDTFSQKVRNVVDGVATAASNVADAVSSYTAQQVPPHPDQPINVRKGVTNQKVSTRAQDYSSSSSAEPVGFKPDQKPAHGKGAMFFSKLLGVGGAVIAGMGAISFFAGGDVSDIPIIGIFAVVSFLGFYLKKRFGEANTRLNLYRTFANTDDSVSITYLSSTCGIAPDKLRRELADLCAKGLLGKYAFLDLHADKLVFSKDYKPVVPDETPANDTKSETEEPQVTVSQGSDEYYEIIKELRSLNESIPDKHVSEQIEQIEDLTSKIFREVEKNPDKLPQIKSFMSYYLPTTLKLLRSYSGFVNQGVKGENVDAAKRDIENVLDTLVEGFSQQLDRLFKSEYLDISTDIEVLEGMLAKDGLSGDTAFMTMPQ